MMKLALCIALALLALASPSTGQTGNSVTAIQSMTVQIWPDYDRPAVLVMLTGTLPRNAPLPAFVTLPLLPGAELNAVARADASGNLFSDIVYAEEGGKLSLSTPNPKFRVEYYAPYWVEGGEHHFTFDWLADVSVEALSVIVQKPAAATSLVTEPPTADVTRGDDGLTYHMLPMQAAPAREPLSVKLSYASPTAALTAERRLTPPPPAAPAPAPKVRMPAAPAAPVVAAEPNLGLGFIVAIFATAAVSIGVTWHFAGNRTAPGAGGATPPAETPPASHCPGCGLPRRTRDRFCSACGQELPGES
jgi:hypothetical protein